MAVHDHSGGQIWHLARQGDTEAYVQLRREREKLVRTQLRRYCHKLGHFDLDDLEQEVWIAVWTALPRFQGCVSFNTWLVAVTKNVLWSWLRHKRSQELGILHFREIDEANVASTEKVNPLDRLIVDEAIGRLSQPQREVIQLRYFQQLADQEIAGRLHIPLGTVKGRIRSGLSHLRRELTQDRCAEISRW